jgi:hypothetical protein
MAKKSDTWGFGIRSVLKAKASGQKLLLLCSLILIVTSAQGVQIPGQVEDRSDRDLQELEALFSGASPQIYPSGFNLSPSAYSQMFGQPDPMESLYTPPFAGFLKNNSIFGGFVGSQEQLVPPMINLTWRELYLGGFSQESATYNSTKPFFG